MTERKEKHKKRFKERGITLIALVITIIVLLILAGVALAALTGDSGILSNAEKAKGKINYSNAKEQIELAAKGALISGYAQGNGIITRENLKTELDNIVGEEGKDYVLSKGEAPWTVTIDEYQVKVYSNGKIENEDQEEEDDQENQEEEENITISVQDLTLKLGESGKLNVTITPSDNVQQATYVSKDTTVVTVDENGNVTGNKVGTAKVEVTYKGKSAECTVTVEPIVTVTGNSNDPFFQIYDTMIYMSGGNTIQLGITTSQGTAVEGVTYTSGDETIATVDRNGVVTGISHGYTTITVRCDGYSKTYDLKVEENIDEIIVEVEGGMDYFQIGDIVQLKVTTQPTKVPKGTFTYESEDETVATVDENGVVKVIGEGFTMIRVTYNPPRGSEGPERMTFYDIEVDPF
jgi:uncharacterized protein YjdB